jgi:hypothetical protein
MPEDALLRAREHKVHSSGRSPYGRRAALQDEDVH